MLRSVCVRVSYWALQLFSSFSPPQSLSCCLLARVPSSIPGSELNLRIHVSISNILPACLLKRRRLLLGLRINFRCYRALLLLSGKTPLQRCLLLCTQLSYVSTERMEISPMPSYVYLSMCPLFWCKVSL